MDLFVIVHSSGSYFCGFTLSAAKYVPTWTDLQDPACAGHICVFCQLEAEAALKDLDSEAQIQPVKLPQFHHG